MTERNFCGQCGERTTPGAGFCAACGVPLAPAAANTPVMSGAAEPHPPTEVVTSFQLREPSSRNFGSPDRQVAVDAAMAILGPEDELLLCHSARQPLSGTDGIVALSRRLFLFVDESGSVVDCRPLVHLHHAWSERADHSSLLHVRFDGGSSGTSYELGDPDAAQEFAGRFCAMRGLPQVALNTTASAHISAPQGAALDYGSVSSQHVASRIPSGRARGAGRGVLDVVGASVSVVGKVLTSSLWGLGGVLALGAGEPLGALVAVVYLVYLWVFGGRWLIY